MNLMKLLLLTVFGIATSVHAMTEDSTRSLFLKWTHENFKKAHNALDLAVRANNDYNRCMVNNPKGAEMCTEYSEMFKEAMTVLHIYAYQIQSHAEFLSKLGKPENDNK